MEIVGEGVLLVLLVKIKMWLEVEGLFDFVCKCWLLFLLCVIGVVMLFIGVVICDIFYCFVDCFFSYVVVWLVLV